MPHDLDDAIKTHQPHPKSLLDEESKEAYNEKDARQAFGDEFIDQLMKKKRRFKSDWWQLALLVKNLEEDQQNPKIKDKDRLGAWNKWRRQQPGTVSPDYERNHLERATLRHAHLEYANLAGAHLERANLYAAHLKHADLSGAHLDQAYLNAAHLEHAHLPWGHLEHADLYATHLEHANLRNADLEGADVRNAYLRDALFAEATLNGADVRRAKGLRFDGNRVEGIRIEGNAPDPWSVLRRQYTGP